MTSLYIHIPFCKKKCNYCDFVSYPGKENLIDDYVEALCRELKTSPLSCASGAIHSPLHEMERGGTNKVSDGVRTIFFGGGTPTLLEPKHFEKIFKIITPKFGIRHSAFEISIEANPGTANKTKLKELRQLGINRLSIGAQSFNDQHLKTLGRIHNSKDIFRFYDDARSVGFENINLDLIFALPDQNLEDWKKDIKTAISLNPEHLSTYNLIIEEGTPFWRMTNFETRMMNELPIPNDELELAMYEHTIDTLIENGYHHYEISNFAKPGFECKHNINYWKNGNYIGIGAGAHSHVDGKRWSNPDKIEDYLTTPSSFLPLNKGENVERSETRGGDTLFLGLRMLDGLPIEKFTGFEKEVKESIQDGLLQQENGNYKLTRQGLYLGNEVFAKFV
ncbi:MAG: radical SAM family heme chaperone HemW [Candidatus Margulisiibacteriota bacterium]|nr:radical SAM family heme chaperone HemW [Candidatus Margulisiibacteriota bacterium]